MATIMLILHGDESIAFQWSQNMDEEEVGTPPSYNASGPSSMTRKAGTLDSPCSTSLVAPDIAPELTGEERMFHHSSCTEGPACIQQTKANCQATNPEHDHQQSKSNFAMH